MESDLHSTTKFINMHEAYKALATRWPPSGHLPQAFEKANPKRLSEDYFNKGTHASVNLDQRFHRMTIFTFWDLWHCIRFSSSVINCDNK